MKILNTEIKDFDQELRSLMQDVREIVTDRSLLNEFIGTAMRDGVKLEGEHIPGVIDHIQATAANKHATADRLGAERTSFYEATQTNIEVIQGGDMGGLRFTLNAEIFAHWQTPVIIEPGEGYQWLPVANIAEAYGKRPRWFGDRLKFEPRGTDLAVLVWRTEGPRTFRGHQQALRIAETKKADKPATAATAPKAATAAKAPSAPAINQQPSTINSGDRPVVVYWLIRQATLKADPTLLPSMSRFGQLIHGGCRAAFDKWQPLQPKSPLS